MCASHLKFENNRFLCLVLLVIHLSQLIMQNLELGMLNNRGVDESVETIFVCRSKRNGVAREIVPETMQTFDASSTRMNNTDRWPNAYNNSNRSQHKTDSRNSSDR